MLEKVPPFFKNKFVFTFLLFVGWMIFFDQYDLINVFKLKHQLQDIEASAEFYENEIKQTQEQIDELQTNPKAIERYAREKYLMKSEDEEIIILENPND